MRGIVVFVCILMTSQAWGINHQEELAKAQKWANSFDKSYPIVIVDRDKTNFLIKSNNASEDKDKRFEIINKYFADQADVTLTNNDLVNIDTYVSILTNSAVALPITDGFGGEYKFCAVFINAPNGNAQVETNRLMGFDQKDAYKDYPDYNYNNLNEKMSFEELYLFSLYHEVGHCLDDKFLIDAVRAGGEDAHGVYLAEIYAEVLAYLALVPRLGKEVASRRALYRLTYSRIVGEFLTGVPSFGNPVIGSGGAIYNLGPQLYKVQELLHYREIDLERPLTDITKDFVIENSQNSREFFAIVTFLTEGVEKASEEYEERAFEDPEFFFSAFMELIKYREFTESALEHAFTTRPTADYEKVLAPALPKEAMCESLKNKDLDGYLEVLNSYRSLINEKNFNTASITEMYTTLNELSINCEDE